MRSLVLLAAILFTTHSAAVAAEEGELTLAPAGHWQLDYGDERCRLGRFFGTGELRTLFLLEQLGPSAYFTWTLAGEPLKRLRDGNEVNVQFGPSLGGWTYDYRGMTFRDIGVATMGSGPVSAGPMTEGGSDASMEAEAAPPNPVAHYKALDPDQGSQIEWLSLQSDRIGTVRLELGDMGPAFAAMNTCVEDLVASWGVDVALQKTVVQPPVWKNQNKVARRIQENYPFKALINGNQAMLNMRIIVDALGKPEACKLTDITLAKNFDMDKDPCYWVMRQAEFAPALDWEQKPVRSMHNTAIRYTLQP